MHIWSTYADYIFVFTYSNRIIRKEIQKFYLKIQNIVNQILSRNEKYYLYSLDLGLCSLRDGIKTKIS